MSRRYQEPVKVEIEPTGTRGVGMLHSFTWRGWRYAVAEVVGSWHLQTRWWDRERHSDRLYYRVETPDHGIYELYFDQVSGVWVLDVVQD